MIVDTNLTHFAAVRIILGADRVGDLGHRDPNPSWCIDQIEVRRGNDDRWRVLNRDDPRWVPIRDLIIAEHRARLDRKWDEYLADDAGVEREYEPEIL